MKNGYDAYIGVPFSGIEDKIPTMDIIGSREDECIAIAVGFYLCGKKPLVFLQNSGFGNCLDIITSLLKIYEINIDMLISNRQDLHHKLMGEILIEIMELMKYESFECC